MPRARVNGIEIHYRERGEGYPVFLIHGYTGNLRNWAFQVPVLSREFRMVSMDHRGHGHSDKPTQPEDYSLELMAEDAYGLLEHLGIRECYVVGHSMGGVVAQLLALNHPEPVRALVLVDTAAEVPDGFRPQERAPLLDIAREQGMEAVFEEQLRANPMAEQLRAQPVLLEVWRQQFLMTSREAYLYVARGMVEGQPILDKLESIEVPTLVVCGENDDPFMGPCRRIHERIPGSEFVIIPGAGHTPQIEKPADFNHALTGFLSRVHQGVAAGG
jgi:2-succinyl-6-hydroxy-2,4-cyclohexadiene-1-carboxylate synthase